MTKRAGRIVILTVALAVTLVLSGCQNASAPDLSSLTLNPSCKYNDSDLCKFVNNFKLTKDYSAKSTTTQGATKMESLFESQGDTKSHIVSSQNGKENYNVITIGDTTYTKDYSDGKWWKQVLPKQKAGQTQSGDIKDEITKDEQNDKVTYKNIGKEACSSLTCFKYELIDPANTDSREFLYFDDSQYQLRKTRSEGKDGSVTESLISYTASISAPSPTKDAKPDQIFMPSGGSMPGIPAITNDNSMTPPAPNQSNPASSQDDSGQ